MWDIGRFGQIFSGQKKKEKEEKEKKRGRIQLFSRRPAYSATAEPSA